MAQTKRGTRYRRRGPASHRGPRTAAAAPPSPVLPLLGGLVALGIGIAPAFRGLYFAPQQLVALPIAAVLLVLVLLARRAGTSALLRRPADWAALALAGAYLVACFVAVEPGAAVRALLLRLLYLSVFFAAGELALASAPARRLLVGGILLAGAVTAGSGLLAAAGVPLAGAFAGRRIYTLIQYPDGAAALLGAVLFVAVGLRAAAQDLRARIGLGVLSALMLLTFVFAASRGATLVLVPVAVLLVVALGRPGWREGLSGLLVAGLATAAGALPYARGLSAAAAHAAPGANTPPGPSAVLEAVLLAAAVAAALEWAWFRLRGASLPRRFRLPLAGAGLVLVAAAAAAGARLARHGVLARLGHLNPNDYNAWSRLRWMRDALAMVARRPLLGWGGGGWAAAYRAFQSYNYATTQVHNGWLQIMVSTGGVGLACWLALWVAVAAATVAAYRRADAAERPLICGLAAAAAMLGGHGLIDFTLSLGAISLVLWVVFALLRSAAPGPPAAPAAAGAARSRVPAPRPVPRAAIAVGAGVLAAAILAGVQLSALAAVTAGIRTGDAGNFAAATADFLAALRADPWDETAALDLGQVEWGLTSRTHQLALQRQYAAEAQGSFTRALALDPYDYTARLDYANFLDAQGRDGAGVAQLRAALADAPYVASVYDALAIGLVRAAVPKITSGHAALARPYLAAVPAVAAELKARSAAVPGPALAAVKTGQNAAFPPTSGGVTLALGEADAMENHLSQAAAVLRPLANQPGQLGAEANLWLGAIDQRQGALPASGRALGLAQSGLGSAYAAELQAVNATIGKAG